MRTVREAAVAGMFYPADPVELRQEICHYLDINAVPERSSPSVRAVIVPHAGYPYSGGVAANAYRHLRGCSFKRVVLLGPSHRQWFDGISVAPFSAYQTPMGSIPVDRASATALLQQGSPFIENPQAHLMEHCLEVQLPWLIEVLKPGFTIVPLLFGMIGDAALQHCGQILHDLLYSDDCLFVCSTDLSHDHGYDEAVKMDTEVKDAIVRQDREALSTLFSSGAGEACGRMGLLALLSCLESERVSVSISGFSNSGDAIGDRESRIVGYLSAVIKEGENASS